jgi:hypothetical protein
VKIFRGPRTTNGFQKTDAKSLVDFARDWRPGKKLRFDGTIDKAGQRHTSLRVEVEEQDIIVLHNGLMKYQRICIRELEQERNRLNRSIDRLEEALGKIFSLVSSKQDRAPNTEELLQAVAEIADHFLWNSSREKPMKSRFDWLKWKSL